MIGGPRGLGKVTRMMRVCDGLVYQGSSASSLAVLCEYSFSSVARGQPDSVQLSPAQSNVSCTSESLGLVCTVQSEAQVKYMIEC